MLATKEFGLALRNLLTKLPYYKHLYLAFVLMPKRRILSRNSENNKATI